MHGKYTIAVCDILGFSSLVAGTDIRTLIDGLIAQFRQSLDYSVNKVGVPATVPTLAAIDANPKVGLAWFSDTVLLYTREDTDECMRELLATVGWLLFKTMCGRTRIRAGIAYGDAFIDPANSLYVGLPIVEAYGMEQQQQWSGGALADSAMKRIPDTHVYMDWWVISYPVPLKDGTASQRLAINWPAGFHDPGVYLKWSPQSEEPTADDWRTRKDVCEKWKNIKAFHDAVCERCMPLTRVVLT